jgi:hypothetical protein
MNLFKFVSTMEKKHTNYSIINLNDSLPSPIADDGHTENL